MPKISVIIPVYNVERYLRRCLDSVVSQTFTDFECILIDDASPDGCPAICDEYADKDNKFKVVHKKYNEGTQKARQTGMDIAAFEFITFLDSDDWLEKNALELLYNKLHETDASLVMGGIKRINQNGEEVLYKLPEITKETNLLAYFFLNRCRNLVAKLYKKSLFSDYFIPESNIGEDAVTNVQIFSKLQASEVQVVNAVIYYYDARTNGITSYINPNYISFESNPHIACRLWIECYLNECGRGQNDAVKSAFAYYMISEGCISYLKENKHISRKEARLFYSRYYKPCIYKHLLCPGDKMMMEVFHISVLLGKLYVVLRTIWLRIKSVFIKSFTPSVAEEDSSAVLFSKAKNIYRKFTPRMLRKALWKFKTAIKGNIYKICNVFLWIFPIQNNKIVFANFNGNGYGCNPKYIAEYIIANSNTFDLVWLIDKNKIKDTADFPNKIRVVNYYSLKALYELSTALFWIDNERKKIFPKKKKKQVYIQTWHGDFLIKKIEADIVEKLPSTYIDRAKADSRNMDFLLTAYKKQTENFRKAFWFNGKILEIGAPRTDIFFSENKNNIANEVKNKLEISKQTKIVLYAPTFRDLDDFNFDVDFIKMINAFKSFFNTENVMLLLRPHTHSVGKFDALHYPEYIKNVSYYSDAQEILLISDVLISDYSSISFDFIFTERPIFLYVPDYTQYTTHDRELHVKIEDLPFPYALTIDELCQKIESFNYDKYKEEIVSFMKDNGYYKISESSKSVFLLIQKIYHEYVDKS